MNPVFDVVILLVLATAYSKCTSLEGECKYGMVKFISQFNVDWRGIPTYEDRLSNTYDKNDNCKTRTSTTLDHKSLTCIHIDSHQFKCVSAVESTWVRVWDIESNKAIIDNCGMQWYEKYQDVMKVPCIVDGVDIMAPLKQHVGVTSTITLTIKNRIPEEYDGLHYGGECVWEYEIEGFWSTLVITIFSISIGVLLVLTITLYIYANKHRHEKRNALSSSLVDTESKPQV